MTRKKLALVLLLIGIGCLVLYIRMLFDTGIPALMIAALAASIACNTAALNLFLTRKSGKKDEEDV